MKFSTCFFFSLKDDDAEQFRKEINSELKSNPKAVRMLLYVRLLMGINGFPENYFGKVMNSTVTRVSTVVYFVSLYKCQIIFFTQISPIVIH